MKLISNIQNLHSAWGSDADELTNADSDGVPPSDTYTTISSTKQREIFTWVLCVTCQQYIEPMIAPRIYHLMQVMIVVLSGFNLGIVDSYHYERFQLFSSQV